jgi:hypothetical protein
MSRVRPRPFLTPLRQDFCGSDEVRFSFSQAWQDIFVLVALDGLKGGRYLEIGAGDPRNINNTYLLEKYFDWTGLSLDIDPSSIRSYRLRRENPCFLVDACRTDFIEFLKQAKFGNRLDYLQVDIEPSTNSLIALENFMKSGLRPRVVTFETDFYDESTPNDVSEQVRQRSRELMKIHGYQLVAGDIGNLSAADPFEDWYVDPIQVNMGRLRKLTSLPNEPRAGEVALFEGPHIIATELYDGQGLGNQLWAYVVTRIAALKQNFDFGIGGVKNFKAKSFIDLDFGLIPHGGSTNEGGPPLKLPRSLMHYYSECKMTDISSGLDVSREDKKIWTLPPGTKIDGNFQSYEYIRGHEDTVRSWIQIKPNENNTSIEDEETCLIHIRGGDFKNLKYTAIGKNYYIKAIEYIKCEFGVGKFIAITDDPDHALSLLPKDVEIRSSILSSSKGELKARHHIGSDLEGDFLSLMQAKYLVISNSSFSWWAAFLNTRRLVVIAPKFWSAFNSNSKLWSTAEIITPGFLYMDSKGDLFSAEECVRENHLQPDDRKHQLSGGTSKLTTLPRYVNKKLGFFSYIIRYRIFTVFIEGRNQLKKLWNS